MKFIISAIIITHSTFASKFVHYSIYLFQLEINGCTGHTFVNVIRISLDKISSYFS